MAKDYSQAGARLAAGIQRSGGKWLGAIQALTVNPAALAASAQGMANWLAGVQGSVQKRQNNLAKVQLSDIQAAAQAYGQTNYTNSATKAQAKYEKKLPAMTNLWNAQRAAVRSIPRVPGTNNQGRWSAAVQLAMAAKGKI
jgi:hypothetical protein